MRYSIKLIVASNESTDMVKKEIQRAIHLVNVLDRKPTLKLEDLYVESTDGN